MARLQGGSAGEFSQGNTEGRYGSFFHEGVKSWMLSNKDSVKGRILPAFDDEQFQPNDPAFKTSVKPYRCLEATRQWREAKKNGALSSVQHLLDADTETPRFTDWFITVQGYNFYGPDKTKFLSPISALPPSQKYKAGHDAIIDCLNYVKGQNNPQLEYLWKKPDFKTSVPLMFPKSLTFVNAVLEKEGGELENRVLIYNSLTQEALKETLKQRGGRDDAILSEAFQEFCFGDITCPQNGSKFYTKVDELTKAKIKTSVMYFSTDNQDLNGRQAMPITQAHLEGRYDLLDTDTVTKLATYDEILQTLVETRQVPMDIIHNACSSYGNIPANAPAVHGQSQVGYQAPAPQQQPAPQTTVRQPSTPPANNAVQNSIPAPAANEVQAPAPADDIPMEYPEEKTAEAQAPAATPEGEFTKESPEYARFLELREKVNAQTASVDDYTEYGQLAGKVGHLLAA
jgi:hypothetical protein